MLAKLSIIFGTLLMAIAAIVLAFMNVINHSWENGYVAGSFVILIIAFLGMMLALSYVAELN